MKRKILDGFDVVWLLFILCLLVVGSTLKLPSSWKVEGVEAAGVERFLVQPLRRQGPGLPDEATWYLSTGLFMQDGQLTEGYGYFVVPEGANCGLTVKAVVVPGSTGNIYIVGNAAWGGIGEVYNTHRINGSPAAVAVLDGRYNAVLEMDLGAEASPGDVVLLEFARYGGDKEDQLGKYAYLVGWMVEYVSGVDVSGVRGDGNCELRSIK